MLAGLLAMLAVLSVQPRSADPDMWWQPKTGEVIWTTHTIPTTDLFSYTTNHHAWIPHEWLSQVLIYGAYRLGGYSSLMLWLCFFTASLLIAGYTSQRPEPGFRILIRRFIERRTFKLSCQPLPVDTKLAYF